MIVRLLALLVGVAVAAVGLWWLAPWVSLVFVGVVLAAFGLLSEVSDDPSA